MTESKILSSLPEEEAKNYAPNNDGFELTPEEIEEIKQRRLRQSVEVTKSMQPVKELDDFYNQIDTSDNGNFDPFKALEEDNPIQEEVKKSNTKKKTTKSKKVEKEVKKEKETTNAEVTFKTLDNEIESTKKHAIDAMLNTSEEYEEDNADKVFIEEPISETKSVIEDDKDKDKVFDVQPKQTTSNKSNTVLDNFKVDLDHIEIVDTVDAMADAKNIQTIFSNKATYEVTAFQSGYNAEMTALTLQDISSIMNSTNDVLTNRKKLFREIYSHIESTSIGKLSFTDWSKITGLGDIDTLLYGIYCQTFPTKNEFNIKCPSCGKDTSFVVNNASLIGVADKELMTHRINEIRKTATSVKELAESSLINIEHRIMLPDSKSIVTLKLPSVSDYLDILTRIDQKFLMDNSDTVGMLMYVKNIYVPNIKETMRTGSPKYNLVEDKNGLINILMKLSIDDGIKVSKEMDILSNKYTVEYRISGVKCTHCKEPIGDSMVDMERVLFLAMDKLKEA